MYRSLVVPIGEISLFFKRTGFPTSHICLFSPLFSQSARGVMSQTSDCNAIRLEKSVFSSPIVVFADEDRTVVGAH